MQRNPNLCWSLCGVLSLTLCTLFSTGAMAAQMSDYEDHLWASTLKSHFFGDRPIIEGENIIALDVPPRAEDASLVPVTVRSRIAQTESSYIKTITLIIDNNPGPLAARFHLTPDTGRADMSMRVRVNSYTPIRVIAETNDGQLHMERRFVKASGGCSAPAGADLALAMTRLGKIKLKTRSVDTDLLQLKLNISHPNITGLQMDQVTRQIMAAHFVKEINVSYRDKVLMRAETDIAISENPTFRFHVLPQEGGELKVEVIDSKDARFEKSIQITAKDEASS